MKGTGRSVPFFSFVRFAASFLPRAWKIQFAPLVLSKNRMHVHAAWRARATPITPVLTLTTDGLVLGAGTVIVAATAPRRLNNLHGQEAGVLALLAAAYGKSIAPSVLGNNERAAKAWREGDDWPCP